MAHPNGPTNPSPNQPNKLQEDESSTASTAYTGKFLCEILRSYIIVIMFMLRLP